MAAAAAGCWTCDMCTFENAAAQGFCQMCEYSKPKAVWVETDAEAPLAFGY